MKQNLKKWLALFLAITMVGTSGIFVNNTSLRASEEDPYTSESELAAAEAEIPVQETAVEETAQAEEPAAVEVAAPVEEAAPAEEPVAAEETVAAEEATPAEEPATDETAAVSTAETASASSTAEATASSEETELTDKEKAEASYTYDNQVYTAETADKSVGVTATLTDAKAVPDQATLRVTPVNSGSAFDAYLAALNAQAEEGKSYTSDNTIMYDVAFLLPKYDDNGKAVAGELVEYEPAAGSVKVKFDFRNDQLKNEIGAENPEDVEVAHLPLTDAAKEKADTTADNTNISQNDVNVENIADSKESVSDNAASVELNSLSIISFSNPDAAEAGIKLKVTINFENSANQTDPNATLPVNQYYLQIRDKNWQTTCVPLNGMDGDTSVNELVNGKIEVWLKGFPKSDGTYADFTVGDEYTLTLIALKKEKGITYRPTGTNIDQNDYDVVSVGDMAPGTTVSLESMPDKKNITANDNEVTITFKSGYSDQKSQKEMIGNEPFGYGIWANEFNQTGDHDIESSFAAGKYQLDKDNYVHPDLSNYPGSIMAGEISGSNLHMNIDDGTESQVTIYTPDANKVIADGATVDTSLTAQQIKDKISTQINTVASTADAMASKTTVKLKKDNQNNVSIDFSGFPENETIYVDADEIAGGQFNDKIRINKYPGQTIVFNINETNVALRQILVCNDGTGSTYTPIDMGTDKDLLDSVASHIIWNVPGSGAQVSVDNVAGTFIVPRGTFTIIITSSSGWIVANKVVAKAEWHNVNRHMPVPASSSITVKKKLEGGTLAADQFSFQLIDNKGNVLQTKKNDASGNVQFDSINYEKEGTYTYTIKEVKDSTDSTITYDDGVITVTVTVGKVGSADNYDYKITGVTYSKAGGVTTEGSNTFVNKKQQKGSLTVNKTFVKNGKTNTEYNDEIKVVISKTQLEEGTDADTNNTKTITIRNGEGSVTFDNLDLGSYYVYEVVDGKVTSKHAGYTVSGNENATTLSTSSLTGTVNLINTYSVTGTSTTLGVDKQILGRTVKDGDSFEFVLQADEKNPEGGATITTRTVTVNAVAVNPNDENTAYTLTPNGEFGIKFTKAGTYKFTVHETSAAGAGITNGDDVVVTYKVTDDGNGALLISKDSTGESKTVTVTNTYTAVETDASFGITKTLEGRIADKNDKFVFTMTAADTNPDGAKITNDTVTAKGQDDGTFTTDDKELSIHFSKPGDYTFTVAEQDTKEGGITLADPQTFTYHVEDNFKGALVVTGGPSKEQKAFVNTYNSKEVEANFSIDKQIAGRDVKADDSFSFELLADEKNPEGAAIVDGNVVASAVGQENADGQTVYTLRPDHSFSIKFTKEGTYKFKVHETSAAGNGIKNPEKDVVVTYKVRDDRNGNLVIKKDNLDENKVVTITNTYTAEKVKTSFGISKTLFGRDAEQNEEYTFKLTGDDKNPDGAKITNDTVKATAQDGSTFTTDKEFAISFTKPGDYTFTVTEKGEKAGITNADPQTFTYHVVDDMAGALVVTGGPSEEQKAFVNNFNARYAAARIRGTKKLDDTYGGKTLQAGQFRFELIDKNNKVVDSATNDENGNFVFRTRFFDKAGTYSYFVKEVNAGDRINGISYSDTTYPVSITVDEAQNGQLSIAGDPASVEITNKAFVNVTVSKQWKDNDNALGDRPSEITVHVYRGIAGSAPAELDASPIKLNENGWSSTLTNLPVTDENGNAYIYTVKEDAADNYRSEVTYDYSDGQITANLTNTRIGNIDLVANKKLVNAALKDGQFTFALFHKGEPVLDANGNAITAKNTASGTITFINVPYYSDGYTVREVKGTDDHITYDENEYPITVADGAQTGEAPTFTNTYRPIVLRVRKTSKQDGDPLVGSTYALYQKGEDGNDILVESQTSDANGYMYFKNITPGVLYFFKEVSAPAGHTVDPNPTPIFQAGYVDGNVIIYDENGNQMPETDYTLSSIEDATTEVQDKVDTLKTEDHAFSYSDGQITAVADALDANDPNLKEAKLVVKPLSGEEYDENYRTLVLKSGEIKDAILYDVSFVKDGKEVEPSEGNTITVTIQDANGLSTAGTDKDELTGTVKLIHISNGEVSVVGGSVGIANNKVNQMTVSSDSFSVFGSVLLGSTTNMGGNVMLTAHGVADKVTQLNVKKLDKDSLKPVAGAHLQIRYPDGTVVKDEQGNELDWVSTEQVKTFNRALDVNTEYVLHEVSAPDGYKTADDVHFTIDKFGYVTLLSGSDNAEASRDADTETIDSATLALKDAKMSVVETVTKTLFKHTSKEETVQGKDTVKYVSGTIVKSVQTGDTTQIALMIILLAAAGAALAALLAAKKRSSKK